MFSKKLAALAAVVATIAVLHAFIVVAQRSIELADGQTNLGELDLSDQFRLSWAILKRIGLLMIARNQCQNTADAAVSRSSVTRP